MKANEGGFFFSSEEKECITDYSGIVILSRLSLRDLS